MRLVPLVISAVLLAAPAAADETILAYGLRLVETNCTRCHAIGETGKSPHPYAPPFREAAKNYSYAELLDGFMEGLAVRHKDMPEWEMTEPQAEAIATYIMSLKKTAAVKQDDSPAANGYTLVRKNCARCHAIGETGESPLAKAPSFRAVVRRYDPSVLQEPLAEGIVTGHNEMPEFAFSAEQSADIVAYLQSLKAK
jgi:mono/diheme cytochrome c family protein